MLWIVLCSLLAWCGLIRLVNNLSDKFPRKMARFIHWIHAMTFEGFALLAPPLLHLFPVREALQASGRPILLVHGYGHHGSVWVLQKRWLKKTGLGPIYIIHLGAPFHSIEYYAHKVEAKVQQIQKQTKRDDLILIGHSMGGLVSLWYALAMAKPNTVTDVITLGTPLQGTPIAHLGLGPNARQMKPHSPFLQQLSKLLHNNHQVQISHIATLSDQLVIPGHSAVITDNRHLIIEDLGHISLLFSKRVAKQLIQWIKAAGCAKVVISQKNSPHGKQLAQDRSSPS